MPEEYFGVVRVQRVDMFVNKRRLGGFVKISTKQGLPLLAEDVADEVIKITSRLKVDRHTPLIVAIGKIWALKRVDIARQTVSAGSDTRELIAQHGCVNRATPERITRELMRVVPLHQREGGGRIVPAIDARFRRLRETVDERVVHVVVAENVAAARHLHSDGLV